MLDLESEVNERPRFYPGSMLTRGNILSLFLLFSCSKASGVNIGIIANFV